MRSIDAGHIWACCWLVRERGQGFALWRGSRQRRAGRSPSPRPAHGSTTRRSSARLAARGSGGTTRSGAGGGRRLPWLVDAQGRRRGPSPAPGGSGLSVVGGGTCRSWHVAHRAVASRLVREGYHVVLIGQGGDFTVDGARVGPAIPSTTFDVVLRCGGRGCWALPRGASTPSASRARRRSQRKGGILRRLDSGGRSHARLSTSSTRCASRQRATSHGRRRAGRAIRRRDSSSVGRPATTHGRELGRRSGAIVLRGYPQPDRGGN